MDSKKLFIDPNIQLYLTFKKKMESHSKQDYET